MRTSLFIIADFGRFLLVQLHLEALVTIQISGVVPEVLRTLPETLDERYEQTYNRLLTKDEEQKNYALSILAWVTYAVHPLSVDQLRHTIAVEKRLEIDEKMLLEREQIISFCCGLIIIDRAHKVRFVHYSAQVFFQSNKANKFSDYPRLITLACERYLSLPELERSVSSEHETLKHYPFAEYAALHLKDHFQDVRKIEEVTSAIRSLVLEDSRRAVYCKLLHKLKAYFIEFPVLDDDQSALEF